MKNLEENGLGQLMLKKTKGSDNLLVRILYNLISDLFTFTSLTYEFHKTEVPNDHDKQCELLKQLNKYNVSLLEV